MMVQDKKTSDFTVVGPATKWSKLFSLLRPHLDGINIRRYKEKTSGLFSPANIYDGLAKKIKNNNPDIVHLFWVAGGFFKIETLANINRPIIWTLHDMWPFTGGCHYDEECGRFKDSCGSCPVLHSDSDRDLSRQIWSRKNKSWEKVPIVVVATSHWLADMARESSLFKNKRIEVLPNGLDTDIYKPAKKFFSRSIYNLPLDKQLIMFSAFSATFDKRKGNQYLVPALRKLVENGFGDKIELVIVGANMPENPPDLGMKVHYIGNLHDEISQVLLYSAVDVVVAPSMQENLSNTVMESLACGTPVVAFDIGGMPDMIDHQKNGFLAKPFDIENFSSGISWVLEDESRHKRLSSCARETVVERYKLEIVAKQYESLYQNVLNDFEVEK
jgi:glycosyltransferase involved in cell wall biosynthesis